MYRLKFILLILLIILLEFFIAPPVITASTAEVVFIVNKSVNEKTISRAEIKNIFIGVVTRWPDKQKIRFAILTKADEHEIFTKKYINKSISQFRCFWRNQVFTGQGNFPKIMSTEQDIIAYVARTKGAIGYISSSVSIENVNVLRVIDDEKGGAKNE